jgi:hypothetical protein
MLSQPPVIGAVLVWTELLLRVDCVAVSSREHQHWRRRVGRRGVGIPMPLTFNACIPPSFSANGSGIMAGALSASARKINVARPPWHLYLPLRKVA